MGKCGAIYTVHYLLFVSYKVVKMRAAKLVVIALSLFSISGKNCFTSTHITLHGNLFLRSVTIVTWSGCRITSSRDFDLDLGCVVGIIKRFAISEKLSAVAHRWFS